jgi:hypothetical protein
MSGSTFSMKPAMKPHSDQGAVADVVIEDHQANRRQRHGGDNRGAHGSFRRRPW